MWGFLGTMGHAFHWIGIASIALKVSKVLGSFGLGVITYKFVAPEILSWFQTQFAGIGLNIAPYLYLAKLDVCISIIIGAVAFKMGSKMNVGVLSGVNT